MLRKNVIAQGVVLGSILAKRGIGLEAHVETPLATLVEESVADAPAQLAIDPTTRQSVVAAEPVEELLTRNSTREETSGVYAHDQALEQTIDKAAKAVQFNLDLAKNVVNPMIERVVEHCKSGIASVVEAAVSPYRLVPYYAPAIYESGEFSEFVSRYADSEMLESFTAVGGAIPANLDDYFSFGVLEYDQHLDVMKEALGRAGLEQLWTAVMLSGSELPVTSVLIGTAGDTFSHYLNAGNAPLVLALALRLYDNPMDSANCSIEQWNEYFSKLVACAGAATVANYRRLRKLPSQFELGRRGEEVLVSGLVLDRYLAEGGEVDAVYGALSTDERLDVASILERQEQLRKAWAIRFSVLQRTANHRKTGALVRALAQALATEIRDLPDDQAAIPRENLQERVPAAIEHIRDGDADRLWYVARKAVCRTIFPHTDAERILRAIDNAVEKNPELDIREASLLATMDYVVEWVAEMVSTRSVKAG